MNINCLLSTKISFLEKLYQNDIQEIDLLSILNDIRSEKYFRFTNILRQYYLNGDFENYTLNKKKLPVVIFGGLFKGGRTKQNLANYNSLIVIDIDKIGKENISKVKQNLESDKFVFAYWESPSQDGIKGLVHLKFDYNISNFGIDLSHKTAFSSLEKYFNEQYNIVLDNSGSDFTRLCFLSHDKTLVIKDEFVSFEVTIPDKQSPSIRKNLNIKSVKTGKNYSTRNHPFGKNNPIHRKIMKDIIRYLSNNNLSITNSYDNWLRVGFSISTTFTYDVGIKYYIDLCQLDEDKFNMNECINMLMNCYEYSRGEISFNSIIYLAIEKGFKYRQT